VVSVVEGIVAKALRREFRAKDGSTRVAVDGLDLEVNHGELVAMLGPNGAGKTTSARMLTGLLLPTSGTARIHGFDVVRQRRAAAAACGWSLGGDLGLYPRLTAQENLTFVGLMYGGRGRSLQERATRLLEEVGLADRADDQVSTFSRGMKQRLHLARALIHEPPVLVLDEPSAGLDPQSAAAMRTLVRGMADAGRCVLLTTHDMREAEEISDRVVLMRDGAVHAEASATDLRLRAAQHRGFIVEVVWHDSAAPDDCAGCPGLISHTTDRGTTRLRVRDGGEAVQWMLATHGARTASVSVAPPSLEEVFFDLVGAG
jgi:ABC-2 type transport system ATP-binding protein